MFDEMTITKAAGGFLAGFLVLLLAGKVSSGIYHADGGHHGKDDHHVMGYMIDTGDDHSEVAEAEPEVPFEEVYASADAGAGERLWRQCGSCHKLEPGANGTGPYLHGVVNRAKAAAGGYGYSDVLASMGGDWTPENLSAFIEDPKGYAPGTAMNYRGMSDVEDRANLIAYIATFN